MLGWMKTLLVSGFVIGLVVYSGVTMTQQNSNTRATMEVEGALMTALLGDSRGQGVDSGLSRDEFITAVVGSIVETQKNHGKTVKVSYIFIDKGGNETAVEEDIQSIQFKTEILNKKNPDDADSVSEKRIALDVIGNRGGVVDNGVKTKVIVFEQGIERRTKTESIGAAPTILGVTVDNGTVTHTVNGNDITVNVNDGKDRKKLVSGALTPEHTKYVQGETTKGYQKDGYVGELEEYVSGGAAIPEDTKYVDKQASATYNKDGYKGALERYVQRGEYIPAKTKTVTNQLTSTYSDGDGYRGALSAYVYSGAYTPGVTIEVRDIYVYWFTKDGVSYEELNIVDNKGHSTQYTYVEKSGDIRLLELASQKCHYWNSFSNGLMGQGCNVTYTFPSVDTRVYRYQGTVTQPGLDTRVYAYRGEVKKDSVDSLTKTYRGYVTKPQMDTRTYTDGYTYAVTVKYRN